MQWLGHPTGIAAVSRMMAVMLLAPAHPASGIGEPSAAANLGTVRRATAAGFSAPGTRPRHAAVTRTSVDLAPAGTLDPAAVPVRWLRLIGHLAGNRARCAIASLVATRRTYHEPPRSGRPPVSVGQRMEPFSSASGAT